MVNQAKKSRSFVCSQNRNTSQKQYKCIRDGPLEKWWGRGGRGWEFSACTIFFPSLLVQEFFLQVKHSARIFFQTNVAFLLNSEILIHFLCFCTLQIIIRRTPKRLLIKLKTGGQIINRNPHCKVTKLKSKLLSIRAAKWQTALCKTRLLGGQTENVRAENTFAALMLTDCRDVKQLRSANEILRIPFQR